MNEGSGSKYQSKISIESLRSRNSNSLSLGRPSWSQRQPSLNKKVSLVYVMSIESDKKSDIYQQMLQQNANYGQNGFPWNRSSLENNKYFVSHQNGQEDKRNSYEQRPILHSCDCFQDCNGKQCPCFSARNQICLKQSCCSTCIQMKNALLLADRGQFCTCKFTQCLKSYCKCFQNNGVCTSMCRCEDCKNKVDSKQRHQAMEAMGVNPQESIRKFCTCKKTKCNKKYCSCYAMGVKCTKACECQNCTNCDYIIHRMDEEETPKFVQDEDLADVEFPQKMSFQKPQFVKY